MAAGNQLSYTLSKFHKSKKSTNLFNNNIFIHEALSNKKTIKLSIRYCSLYVVLDLQLKVRQTSVVTHPLNVEQRKDNINQRTIEQQVNVKSMMCKDLPRDNHEISCPIVKNQFTGTLIAKTKTRT